MDRVLSCVIKHGTVHREVSGTAQPRLIGRKRTGPSNKISKAFFRQHWNHENFWLVVIRPILVSQPDQSRQFMVNQPGTTRFWDLKFPQNSNEKPSEFPWKPSELSWGDGLLTFIFMILEDLMLSRHDLSLQQAGAPRLTTVVFGVYDDHWFILW